MSDTQVSGVSMKRRPRMFGLHPVQRRIGAFYGTESASMAPQTYSVNSLTRLQKYGQVPCISDVFPESISRPHVLSKGIFISLLWDAFHSRNDWSYFGSNNGLKTFGENPVSTSTTKLSSMTRKNVHKDFVLSDDFATDDRCALPETLNILSHSAPKLFTTSLPQNVSIPS